MKEVFAPASFDTAPQPIRTHVGPAGGNLWTNIHEPGASQPIFKDSHEGRKGKEALALAYIYRGFCNLLLPMCSLASLFRRPFARYAGEDGEMTALLAKQDGRG